METTTLGNRRKRVRQVTPCTRLVPDFPINPGKMCPSIYPTAWFRGKPPDRSARRSQSFADLLLRFVLAARRLTVSRHVVYLAAGQLLVDVVNHILGRMAKPAARPVGNFFYF